MRDPGEFAPPQRLLPEPSPATPVPTRKRYKYIMEWIAKSRTRNRTSSLAETLASRHSLALPDASLRHRRCEVPLYLSGNGVNQALRGFPASEARARRESSFLPPCRFCAAYDNVPRK